MRKHAEWMAHPDDRILEFLAENGTHRLEGIRSGLKANGSDLVYPRRYLEKRCERLLEHGLVGTDGRPDRYAITTTGRAYLQGSLDAASLEGSGPSESDESGDGLGLIE